MNAVLATFVISAALGAEPAPKWQSDYGVALKSARYNHRPLLIVLENANDPAKSIEQVQYNKDSSQVKLLNTYSLCRIDVSTEYGQRVAKAFKATQFPYTVITNTGASRIKYRKAGQFTGDQWNAALVAHKSYARTNNVSKTNSSSRSSGTYSTRSRGRFCPT